MIHHSSFKTSCSVKADTVVEYTINYVVFEVLSAVVMKISIVWDITPCSPSKGKIVPVLK
jgi:hypothetical protein